MWKCLYISYNHDINMEGYTTLMSDIQKLCAIALMGIFVILNKECLAKRIKGGFL
jgi:hypothetical protein